MNINIVLLEANAMLIINRYKCPISGKTSVCAHKIVNMQVVKSYKPCDELFIEMLSQGYKSFLLCDVPAYSMLSKINIVKS